MSLATVPVLTKAQARAVLGNRTPLVPIEYDDAVKALTECISLDEAKYWSDKSDALAAWARIYRDDTITRKAKQLKLHAYKRMGLLAKELAKPIAKQWSAERTTRGGKPPGAVAVLRNHGMSLNQASAAVAIAKLPNKEFRKIIERDSPPTPLTLRVTQFGRSTENYKKLTSATMGNGLTTFRTFCRQYPAASIAIGLTSDEAEKVRELMVEINEWLDELDQNLP